MNVAAPERNNSNARLDGERSVEGRREGAAKVCSGLHTGDRSRDVRDSRGSGRRRRERSLEREDRVQLKPVSGFSPTVTLSVDWGDGEVAMSAASMMGQHEPGLTSPYDGIGDQDAAPPMLSVCPSTFSFHAGFFAITSAISFNTGSDSGLMVALAKSK